VAGIIYVKHALAHREPGMREYSSATMTPLQREVLALIHAELGAAPPGVTGEQVAALGQRLGLSIPHPVALTP